MQFYIVVGLLVIAIILMLVTIVKLSKKNDDASVNAINNLSNNLNNISIRMDSEFERSRRENANSQRDMRAETTKSLSEMNEKIEHLRLDNSESQRKMEQTVQESLNQIRDKNEQQSERQAKLMGEAVEKMRESNEKKLEEMRQTVDEKLTSTLSTRLDSSFKTVSDRLENVYKSLGEMKELSNGVTNNVTALNRVLTNVKARGTWAEVQLGSILDQTIPGMYEKNFAPDPSSTDRVEFAVKIPSNDGHISYLPIDSKFPMEGYIRLCEAADNADAEGMKSARKAIETTVVNEAKSVSKYINIPVTTPFAILYLATEGLYAEITSSRNGIAEKIQTDYNVMLAGPSTITALLNSLSLGFRAVAINEKANEVREILSATKQQYKKFEEILKKVRKKIDEAGTTLDEAENRNRIIKKRLGSVEVIDGTDADNVLGINDDIDNLSIQEENL